MLKLSIIGCGNVAKTMGFLWHQAASVEITDVVNRSQASANQSVAFIGAGNAVCRYDKLQHADIFVIACGDDQIETCLDELLAQNIVKKNNILFHFSGAKSSEVLSKAKELGASCASLHPVKSFADPSIAVDNFAETYCGVEGDANALQVLERLVTDIGSHTFRVETDKKLTYHAASVFACNYLVALQELSIRALEQSGVDAEMAMKILQPIVKETTENIFKMGTAKALTGPVSRGDHQLVAKQLRAVSHWDKDAGEIYRLLGKLSTDLSAEKGLSDMEDLAKLRALFK